MSTIYQGSFELVKRGQPTTKAPEGNTTKVSFPWRVVRDEAGEPACIAVGTSGGMQYAIKLTKGQMLRAIEEIERLEDTIRAEVGERWGG